MKERIKRWIDLNGILIMAFVHLIWIIFTIGLLVNEVGKTQSAYKDLTESLGKIEARLADHEKRIQEAKATLEQKRQTLKEIESRLEEMGIKVDKLLETFDLAEEYEITAYAPLDPEAVYGLDYIGDPNVTASGEPPIPGKTVAASRHIPFGTRIWIGGIGIRTVNDRGGAIKQGRLDLCMATRDEAIRFGRQKRKVIILKKEDGK